MKIDIESLHKQVHFPIVQAQPTIKAKGLLSQIKKWATFKRTYEVIEEYILWSEHLGMYIFVPASFQYDNASTPKLLNSFYKSDGLLLLGSLPHDFSYRYQGLLLLDDEGFICFKPMSQAECDIIFEKLCTWESGLPKSSKLAKKALSLIGGFTYRSWEKEGLKVANDFPGLF